MNKNSLIDVFSNIHACLEEAASEISKTGDEHAMELLDELDWRTLAALKKLRDHLGIPFEHTEETCSETMK